MDKWTSYSLRIAGIVVSIWFLYQFTERAVVDHVLALQQAKASRVQLQQCMTALQAPKVSTPKANWYRLVI